MLTAKAEEVDKIIGLEMGLMITSQTFSIKELIARVRAMLRRRDNNKILQKKNLNMADCALIMFLMKFLLMVKK